MMIVILPSKIPRNTGHNSPLRFSAMVSLRNLALTIYHRRMMMIEPLTKPVLTHRGWNLILEYRYKSAARLTISPGAPKLRSGGAGLQGKHMFCVLRVSTVAPQAGGAEMQRDVRGWAMKIFTEEGNQDFVFNSIVSVSPMYVRQGLISTSLFSSSAIQLNSRV